MKFKNLKPLIALCFLLIGYATVTAQKNQLWKAK